MQLKPGQPRDSLQFRDRFLMPAAHSTHPGVDRRRGAALAVQAVVERGDHLVLALHARVDVDERTHAVQAQDGEVRRLQGAQVAARALDPQQLDVLARDGVGRGALGGGVPAGVVGVAGVAAEPVGAGDEVDDRVRGRLGAGGDGRSGDHRFQHRDVAADGEVHEVSEAADADLFRAARVSLGALGTYVNLAGGHVYPEKVMASERKPIRIFMIDGRNDNRGVNADGKYDQTRDWFYQNVRLMKALIVEAGLDEISFYDPTNFVWPFGAHACVSEVDVETGRVDIVRYCAVDDCGPAINPLLIDGQVHGGITHGLGQALFEQVHYDESGQLVTGSFLDYALPTAAELPSYETDRTETPSPINSLGVKGVGEAGTIAGSATVTNAVIDALRPLGVTYIDMPLTPMRVWTAINEAKGGSQ